MPKIVYVKADGDRREIEVPTGWSVMEGAVQNDVEEIVAECGGGCACATCHVYVDPSWISVLDGASDMENDMLECTAAERKTESRLGCQIKITDQCEGLIVHLPDTQT